MPKFYFDEAAGVYRNAQGRLISEDTLRKVQASTEAAHSVTMYAMAVRLLLWQKANQPLSEAAKMTVEQIAELVPEDLRAAVMREVAKGPRLAPEDFQDKFQKEIEDAHRVNTVLGAGGFGAMTIPLWTAASRKVTEQKAYALRFAKDISRGTASPAQTVTRAASYSAATYGTFTGASTQRAKASGKKQARRHLDPSGDHCADSSLPGCPSVASNEWKPIEEVTPIGETTCRINCRCWIEYREEGKEPVAQITFADPEAA